MFGEVSAVSEITLKSYSSITIGHACLLFKGRETHNYNDDLLILTVNNVIIIRTNSSTI